MASGRNVRHSNGSWSPSWGSWRTGRLYMGSRPTSQPRAVTGSPVTRALHGLTGLPALVEDRFGRLRSWAGPDRPDPYPEPDPVRQNALLNEAAREAGPTWIGGG